MTYRIQLFNYTTKGKTNYISDIFITSDANKDEVTKYYQTKYKPIAVSVSEVETVEINLEEKPEKIAIEKLNSGSSYSEPDYRIDRSTLPAEVQELLDHLEKTEKDISDTKTAINKIMWTYFSSGGAMQSYTKDSITCRGYIKPLVLNLNTKTFK